MSTLFHEELASAARWLPRGIASRWTLPLFRMLPSPRVKLRDGVTVAVRRLPGTSASVRILGPRSECPTPVLMWMHGGGYIIGSAQQDDATCARYVKRLGVTVVSVDYRLAPEHPFPAPLEDCFAAYELIQREAASLGVDATRLVFAGQSAGGGLAAALALLVHDRKCPSPVLQLLVYPMIDDRTVLHPVDGTAHRVWDQKSNRFGWASYLARAPGSDGVHEHAAPARRADLTGLPPAWIGVGSCDLFHDENVAYAERLRAAGVPTTLEIVQGAFHGFDAVVPDKPVSRRFFDAQVKAVKDAIES